MARFHGIIILGLLLFWQQQLCVCKSDMRYAVSLNSTAVEITDAIWSKLKNKNDFLLLDQLTSIDLWNGIYLNPNRHYYGSDITDKMRNKLNVIDYAYKDLVIFYKEPAKYANIILYDLIITVLFDTERGESYYSSLNEVYNLAIHNGKESFIELALRYNNETFKYTCLDSEPSHKLWKSYLQSRQQYYHLFGSVMKLVYVKYLLMLKQAIEIAEKFPIEIIRYIKHHSDNIDLKYSKLFFSEFNVKYFPHDSVAFWECRSTEGEENLRCNTKILKRILDKPLQRAINYINEMDAKVTNAVKLKMKSAPRNIWRCDSEEPGEGRTYTKFNNLFRGYFTNPSNPEICLPENEKHPCRITPVCIGQLKDCERLDLYRGLFRKSNYLKMCTVKLETGRRYTYAEYAYSHNPQSYGNKDYQCSHIREGIKRVNSELPKPISYCICEESRYDSDQFISLMPSVAQSDHVVTGIRFVKENHVLYIQIQEGKLGPEANIVDNNATWSPITPIEITDKNVNEHNLHKLQWDSGRRVHLTDKPMLEKYVALVGIGFRESVNKDLGLVFYAKRFDFNTGKLFGKPITYSHFDEHNKSDNLSLDNLDVPTKSIPPSDEALSNEYIQFTTSSLDTDIGQNTIPFIDIQDVTTTRHTPISGAGLYYKSTENLGGFLGLKIYTYDLGLHY